MQFSERRGCFASAEKPILRKKFYKIQPEVMLLINNTIMIKHIDFSTHLTEQRSWKMLVTEDNPFKPSL